MPGDGCRQASCTIAPGSGKIEDISGDDVQLNVNAGNLIMREINAEKLTVEVGAGKANAERIQTENAYFPSMPEVARQIY